MSAAKHTPGPWAVEQVTSGERKKTLVYLRISHEGTAIAGVAAAASKKAKGEVAAVYARHVDARAEADARLIAAAPVMVQLLRDFVAIGDPLPLQATARLKIEAHAILAVVEGK